MPVAAPPGRRSVWPAPAPHGGVVLRYLEPGPVLVRGPVTGLPYEFSAGQPARSVDARDAEVLLRTRRFVRA